MLFIFAHVQKKKLNKTINKLHFRCVRHYEKVRIFRYA